LSVTIRSDVPASALEAGAALAGPAAAASFAAICCSVSFV
jgi:hypothetical protein